MDERAGELLDSARKILVITGAGISAESGVPTFRGKEGLWRTFRAEELATPEAFNADPVTVWEWYDWRRGVIAGCRPNAAHEALVLLEQRADSFLLLTQNVDGLHQLAGSRNVETVHGSIWEVRCMREGTVEENRQCPLTGIPPVCRCGSLLRPNVVWYGEILPTGPFARAAGFLSSGTPDVALVIGTSALLPYIRAWAIEAKSAGAKLVEINPEPSELTVLADCWLAGRAAEILPALMASMS